MSERRGLLGDLSWIQIVVGALAAMTSAWIASAIGVAGTIVGAATGSLIIPVSSALYARTLDKGRVLVVKTDRGTTVEQQIEPGETAEMLQEAAFDPTVRDAEVLEREPRLRWKAILVTTVVVLALAVAAMGAYELISGRAYGSDPDNPRIGNPFGGGSGSEPTNEPTTESPASPGDEATPAPRPTATPTPTVETPAPTPTATTPAPTTPAPTPAG